MSFFDRTKRNNEAKSTYRTARRNTGDNLSFFGRLYNSRYQGEGELDFNEIAQELVNGANALVDKGNALATEHNTRYSSGNDTYRADSSDWKDRVASSSGQYDSDYGAYMETLNKYKLYFSDDFISSLTDTVDGDKKRVSDILRAAEQDREYWSQFKDESEYKDWYYYDKYSKQYGEMDDEAYGKAWADVESRYNAANTSYGGVGPSYVPEELEREYNYLKSYGENREIEKQNAEYLSYDAAAGQQEIDRLEQIVSEYEAITVPNTAGMGRDQGKIKAALDNYKNSIAAWEQKYGISYEEAKSRLYEAEKYHKTATNYQYRIPKGKEYDSLRSNADFAQNSGYASTKVGDREIDWLATIGGAISNAVTDSQNGGQIYYKAGDGYRDIMYDLINGNPEALRYVNENNLRDNGALAVGSGIASLDYLTLLEDKEKQIFNYIYHTEGKDAAYEYITFLEPELNARNREATETKWANFANEHPVLASLSSVALAPAKGVSFLGQTVDYIADCELEDNARYNALLYGGNAVTSTVSRKIEESGKWGEVGSFGYGVAMSMGEFLLSTAVAGGNPTFAGLIMASGAAADTTLSGVDRGLTGTRAYTSGIVAGLAEFLTEKMGVDNLFDNVLLGKSKFKYFLKNTLSEGIEEGATDLVNWAYDDIYDLISGQSESEWKKMIAEYEEAGYGASEAFGKALGDRALQLGLDIGAGMASGGIMGGGAVALDAVSGARDTAKTGQAFRGKLAENAMEIGDVTSSILGLDNKKTALNENTAAYKQAQKIQAKLDKGKDADNYSIGKLYKSMSESQIVTAVQTRLSANIGNENDARKLSDTITDILYGREVSNKALGSVIENRFAFNALNDALGANLRKGATLSDVKAAIKSYQAAATSKSGANASINAKQGSEVKNSGRGGATFSVQENADGRFDVIAEASGNSGSIASYETRNQAQAAAYGYTLGMGAEGLSGFVYISEGIADGADLGEVAIAYNAIYNQGKQGKALSAVKNMELLSPEQRQYAYNLGIMDRALDSARAKNVAAEISKENDGKVLQKDGVGDTIKENEQGDINSEQQKAERAEAQFAFDGGAESRTFESTSGTRTEDEDRSRVQGEDRGTSQKVGGALTSDRRINRLNPKEINVDLSDTLQIDKEHLLYEPQQKLINEYGIECYIIKERSWHRSSPAGTYKGKVYMSESFSGNLLATVVPHEATHAMKQLNYQPYLDLIDRLPDMLDMSAEATEDMFNWIAGHCGFDFLAMSRSEGMHFYDEMNAAIYGFYKTSMWESDGYAEWLPNAFYDFDSYIAELEAIHEQFKKDVQARKVESYKQVDSTTSDVQQAKSDQASSSEWSAERIKDGKAEKAKPISEIIEQIRHDFGINITKGHVRGKGVLGQYSRKNHGIRTKIANDLPTVAHELGHAIDQRYGLTDKSKLTKEMRSELINALGDLKDSYKQNLWVSEGFAEYLRRFLQNRDDATRSYPEFTKHFLNSLSKTDRLLIDTFADEINAYYSLDADTATSSIRLREEETPDARTALEKAKEMGDGVYQAWVDANHGIKLFDEATGADTYKLATNAAYSDAIAGQIITGDLTDANGQYVAPGLKAALEGVDIGNKKIYREFGEYLVLRHGPERLSEGMRIFADERKNNASFMEKRAGELEAAHPEFKEAADRLYTFQKQFLQTWAVDTGLLPSEVAEEWAKRWSYYVPLNRAVGKAGTIGAKRGYANQNSTIKKAIGSGLDIVHPVDNIINNIVKMVNAGVRNNVMLEITAQAKAVGADATFLEEVPTPMKKKTADMTGVKAKLHDAFGAAGIGELLVEIEGESETQARASGQSSRVSFQNTKSGMAHEKLSAYDEDLSRIIREHGDIIIDNYEKLQEVVDLAFDQPNKKATAYLGSIDPNTLQQILSSIPNLPSEYRDTLFKTGRNYSIAMTLDSIRHIVDDKHLTRVDVLDYLDKLSETILSFDSVAFDVYTDSFGKKTPGLLFKKKFSDGTLISFNLVSNKKKSISLQTLYLNRADYENKRSAETLLMQNASAHTPKAGVGQTSSNNSISQVKENVNKKNSTNSSSGKSDAWSKVDEIIESAIDDVLIQYGQGKAHGDVVTVLREGKQEFWKINDALLLESLTSLSQKKMNGIMEAYAVVSRFMTSNITGNNIIWSIFSNFPRDMMTFFTYSKQKNPLKSFPAMGEAYLNKVTDGKAETKNLPYIKEYYALGGGQTSAYTADVDLAKRARKKLKNSTKLQSAAYYANPLNVLSFVSETVESGPRIATYIMMREKGMSPQDAFYESQDITVNFKRGGRLSREFNKAVPFFNASVQGLDKFKRWITCADVPRAQRAKAIAGRVTMYVAVSAALGALIYALNNGDDEDEENYRLLSNYTKNTYWNIPLGDGKYFAIPKPREIAVLSTFVETTCEYFGGNDYAYDEFGEYVADNFLPPFLSDFVTDGMDGALGSLGMIGVASDLKANKDFLGRPIESTALENYESQDRYTRRTSMIAYWLGQAAAELGLDWSPVQIDYFFSQTLGGYWKVQKALFPVGSENVDWTLGVQNTYVKDNQYSNDIVNWMYDKETSSAQSAKSHPEDTDIAIEAKLDGNMKNFYSRYYALTKGQKEDAAARRAKRVVLDMIVEYRKASDNGDESEAQKVVYGLIDRCHDTSLLPSVMQSKVKDGEGAEHSLRDYQYVEYQTTYNALYWGYVEDNLGGAETDAEMIAIIKKAQTIAKERATEKALQSVGAGSSGYFEKYPSIDDSDLITFQSQMDMETDKDGGLSQEELIGILEGMVADGLSKEDAYTLFKSRFSASDKNNPWRAYAP